MSGAERNDRKISHKGRCMKTPRGHKQENRGKIIHDRLQKIYRLHHRTGRKILLSIDSPSGYCRQVTDYSVRRIRSFLGIQAKRTVKGGVVASLAERNKEDGILLEAHCDTLGGLVAELRQMAVSVLPISEV